MLDIILSNQFKKDLKLASRRGYNLDLLDTIVTKLSYREILPEKYRDHALNGIFPDSENAIFSQTGF